MKQLLPTGAAVADCNAALNYYCIDADNRMVFGDGPVIPMSSSAMSRPTCAAAWRCSNPGRDRGRTGLVGADRHHRQPHPHYGRTGDDIYSAGFSATGWRCRDCRGRSWRGCDRRSKALRRDEQPRLCRFREARCVRRCWRLDGLVQASRQAAPLEPSHRLRDGAAFLGNHGAPVERHAGGGDGRNLGMVIGRRHLDKIHPDQVQRLESADKFQPLPAG